MIVRVFKKINPGTWDKIGATYQVKNYEYKATRGGNVNACSCDCCKKEIKGQRLYPMYQIIFPLTLKGNIIFKECCEVISK